MRTHDAIRPAGASRSPLLASLRAIATVVTGKASGVAMAMQSWSDRWKQRQALMRLDDHLLKDIGVSRADADLEGTKPFWKE